jgi:hypothetical protein
MKSHKKQKKCFKEILKGLVVFGLILCSMQQSIAQNTESKQTEKVSISKEKLESFIGDYEMNPGTFLQILMVNDTLKAKGPGSPALALVPVSENRFFLQTFGVDIAFVADQEGKIEKLLMIREDGQSLEAKKVIKK